MPQCALCQDFFYASTALITHLKIIHRLENNSTYLCGENGCRRNFPALKSFRKHVKSHEIKWHHSVLDLQNNSKTTIQTKILDSEVIEPCEIEEKSYSNIPKPIDWEVSLDCFKKKLHDNNINFISNLYSENTFCRKDVQKIMNYFHSLLNEPLNLFRKDMEQILKFSSATNIEKNVLCHYFKEFENLFSCFESEHLRLKVLEGCNLYIKPVEFIVGQNLEVNKHSVSAPKKYTAQQIPLGKVLKGLFSLPGVLTDTLKYIETLPESGRILNIVQTIFWKNKISCFKETDIVFPIFIYYDDYECGNPLGSRSGIHKLGAVYFSVACLPPSFQSKIENIFLATLFHSNDLKEFGEKIVFSKLVAELNDLYKHGIIINNDLGEYKLYFCLALILGDNLALNTISGFQESFTANSFCRFCKCIRAETQKLTTQQTDKLRNISNYNADLKTKNPYDTGIKFTPVFNAVESFHIAENFAVDISHDIFEGVGNVIMSFLLHQFILVDKFFDLQFLNNKLKFFKFSKTHNKPPLISYDSLKKKSLRMSASEMKTFILNAGLLFSHLVPRGNKYWSLYILLRKILSIVLCGFVTPDMPRTLASLICQHHSLFLQLFSVPLRPKFHILTHYPYIMKLSGPLTKTSCLRYESKHRQSKLAANVIASRVNITRTLAIKHQLQLTSRFVNKKGFHVDIVYSFKESVADNEKSCFLQMSTSSCFREFLQTTVYKLNRISVGSTIFKLKDVIMTKYITNVPEFGKIIAIIMNKDNICFLYKIFKTLTFDMHVGAFQVEPLEGTAHLFFYDMYCVDIFTPVTINNKLFITV